MIHPTSNPRNHKGPIDYVSILFACAIWFAVGLLVLCVGCAGIQDMWTPSPPQTKAKYGAFSGFEFYDTKNNDVDLDAKYNPQTGEYHVVAKIRNNASDVNESLVPLMQQFTLGLAMRVEQMDARTREVEAHGRNIQAGLAEIRGMIGSMIEPLKGLGITIDTPIGGGSLNTGGGSTQPSE